MNSRQTILEELRSLNSGLLINDLQKPVFSLPENYFESFADKVLEKIKNQQAPSVMDELKGLSPLLAGIDRKTPYSVPENYFSTTSEEIPALVKGDEIPPVLKYLGKELPYETPEGYFENFPSEMLEKITMKPAKVVSFSRSRIFRMAAAAMIAGVLLISGYFYFNQNQVDVTENPEEWVAKKLKGVSSEELDEFIETADISTDVDVATGSEEVKELLGDVSVKEIDAFLAMIPTDNEELMVIN